MVGRLEERRVNVQRRGSIRMTESAAHGANGHASGNQARRDVVAEIVEADRIESGSPT
jgi:hypothetical protein